MVDTGLGEATYTLLESGEESATTDDADTEQPASQTVLAWADQLDTLDDFVPFSPGLPLTDPSQAAAPTLTNAGTAVDQPTQDQPTQDPPVVSPLPPQPAQLPLQPSPGPSVTIGPVSKAKTKGGVPAKTPPTKAMLVQPQPANTQVPQPVGQPGAKAPTVLQLPPALAPVLPQPQPQQTQVKPTQVTQPAADTPPDRPHRRQRGQPGTRDVQPVTPLELRQPGPSQQPQPLTQPFIADPRCLSAFPNELVGFNSGIFFARLTADRRERIPAQQPGLPSQTGHCGPFGPRLPRLGLCQKSSALVRHQLLQTHLCACCQTLALECL